MKTGLLEKILIRRYGQPVRTTRRDLPAFCWNPDEFDYATVLYVGMEWNRTLAQRFGSLKEIYGNAFGGFLIKNALKVAMLPPHTVYGLWNIGEFRMQPEVQHALAMDPGIDFFMDRYMILFYGIKKGDLYVFDSETDELDSLGPIEPALETVLDELEAVLQDL
jgi:hypothetical protein